MGWGAWYCDPRLGYSIVHIAESKDEFVFPVGSQVCSVSWRNVYDKRYTVKFGFKQISEMPARNFHCYSAESCFSHLANRDEESILIPGSKQVPEIVYFIRNSTENLLIIVMCIIEVYVRMWFRIKTISSIVEGHNHISKCIKNCRIIFTIIEEVVKKILNEMLSLFIQKNFSLH